MHECTCFKLQFFVFALKKKCFSSAVMSAGFFHITFRWLYCRWDLKCLLRGWCIQSIYITDIYLQETLLTESDWHNCWLIHPDQWLYLLILINHWIYWRFLYSVIGDFCDDVIATCPKHTSYSYSSKKNLTIKGFWNLPDIQA